MGMAGKRCIKLSQELGVAMAQLRSFADPLAGCMIQQDQTTARLTQPKALRAQPTKQIIPIPRIGKIVSEKRPQGSDEPLIRPDRRLRFFPALQIADDGITNDLANRYIVILGSNLQCSKHRGGQLEGDFTLFHRATVAQRW